ncbi:SDR family oxidoreductase [Thalassotalea sp. 1_MG-2023]|uniref:SDR family NAD(P)-dependent oxidoreductase n=1 Tax=Thalassotalea sp. 1_MG-2023 TaxID=3062680 RepID=UPI0026E38775|nr:SDR family oxidoreductase [Thalassotalea sp. 1_MG-2023]MDO6426103.1 SDR family oxidoreductase [Thalassotalea sp. 1_MG-2023]
MQKHMLITGASSGIGRALAILAEEHHVNLSLCGRNKNKLTQTLKELKQSSNTVADSFCITENSSFKRFLSKANAKHGDVDVLVNCAGLNNVRKQAQDLNIEEITSLMEVNFYAPIQCINSVLPQMLPRKSGTVINILSTVCLYSNPGIAAYTASKAALDSYTKVMRKELKDHEIKMLSVYPGGVDTQFRDESRSDYLSATEVAKAIFHQINTDDKTHIHELVIRPSCEENF